MWSQVSVHLVPAWNSATYRVVATWRDDGLTEPVVLTREGVIDLGDADNPAQMLSVLARVLVAPPADSQTF
jgi:hypothetical protein